MGEGEGGGSITVLCFFWSFSVFMILPEAPAFNHNCSHLDSSVEQLLPKNGDKLKRRLHTKKNSRGFNSSLFY